MIFYKIFTVKLYSFLVSNTMLLSNNCLRFRQTLLEKLFQTTNKT